MTEDAVPLPYEVQEMTTTEARKNLPELVNLAAYGHVTTVLTRDGKRLARIVPEEGPEQVIVIAEFIIHSSGAEVFGGPLNHGNNGRCYKWITR